MNLHRPTDCRDPRRRRRNLIPAETFAALLVGAAWVLLPAGVAAQGNAGPGPGVPPGTGPAASQGQGQNQTPPLVTSPPPSTSSPGGSATPPTVASPGSATSMRCGPGDMGDGPGRGLAAADGNRDGRVSRSEFLKFHEAMFDQMPKDTGGQVALDMAMRQRGGAGREMGRGMGQEMGRDPGKGINRDLSRDPNRSDPPGSRTGTPPDPATEIAPEAATPGRPGAASSSRSAPASTPSSSAPQEAKPGKP